MPIDPSTVKQARQDPNTVNHGHFTMPLWAWAVVGGVGVFFGYKVWKARNSASTSSTGTAAATTGASATGCVDANNNPTPCPVYVPVPTATPTGVTPAQNQEYQNLLKQITSLQGNVSTLSNVLTPGMQDNLASNLNQIENDLEGTKTPLAPGSGTAAGASTNYPGGT